MGRKLPAPNPDQLRLRMNNVHRHHLLLSAGYNGAARGARTRSKSCNTRSRQQSGALTGQAPASIYRTGTQRQGAVTSAGRARPKFHPSAGATTVAYALSEEWLRSERWLTQVRKT